MRADRDRGSILGAASAVLPLALTAFLLQRLPQVAAGAVFHWQVPWVPSAGVALAFTLDGLSLLFALTVCFVGTFVSLYAAAYLPSTADRGKFYAYLHGFLLAMLGLVLADDAVALFVFWELTALLSYLLIGFECEAAEARRNARQALLVTGAGGLALLVGLLMLRDITGSANLSGMAAAAGRVSTDPHYLAVLLLVLLGAFTKSAQFPFHFWLPNAMTAPTPISAFLHSATMVKAGVYLLARLHPVLGGTSAWMGILVVTGGVTALYGSFLANCAEDLKRILAYTTIMALGILTMFLGGRTTPAMTAALTFMMVHSLYKSALFLVAGIIDHQTGTRRLDRLGGLARAMPLTAAAAAAAALSMAGFPLFFGFVGKEIMYKGALTEEVFPGFCTVAALAANALMTTVAATLMVRLFLGPLRAPRRPVREAPWQMWLGPAVLGGLCVVFGIVPDWIGHWLIEPAVRTVQPAMETIQLTLFSGVNEPLVLSAATLVLGAAGFRFNAHLKRAIAAVRRRMPLNGDRVYDAGMDALAAVARAHTRFMQNGSLQRYLGVVIAVVVAGSGVPFVLHVTPALRLAGGVPPLAGLFVSGLVAAALVVVVRAASRLLAICGLGVVGAGIALLFLMHGAPDVALTQLLVETLTVIIVSLVLLRLPPLSPAPKAGRRLRAGLAAAAGALVAGLLLAVLQSPMDRSVTAFFEANSYALAHGRNIVNVILVDFRSIDTLGEITVVAVAGIAGYGLIRGHRKT